MHRLRKADNPTLLAQILDSIENGKLVLLMEDAQALLQEITHQGAGAALDQLGFVDDESIVSQVNARAVAYARDRSAEMVGKKWVGDILVDNPNAEWRIDEATRELLRADVTAAMEEGWSNDKLAEALEQNYAFSEERAETIARTETAFADVQGNLDAYRESGQVQGKRWIVGDDCCDECYELDGEEVGLEEEFPNGGGDAPPLHPNCRCDVVAILIDELPGHDST